MGAVHGKDRFRCGGCQRGFSWRLDLRHHTQHCKAVLHSSVKTEAEDSEQYWLECCFLCGCQLTGMQCEEASFITGLQKLYHSKRPLIKVLEDITQDQGLSQYQRHTMGLCRACMTAVNRWDKLQQELHTVGSSLRHSYKTRGKRRKTGGRLTEQWSGEVEDPGGGGGGQEDSPPRPITALSQPPTPPLAPSTTTPQAAHNKQYKCHCGTTVKGLNLFVEHQLRNGCKVRTNEHPCKFCGTVFQEKKLMVAHRKACVKSSLVNGAHECDICGRRFLVRGRVETHKRMAHSIGTADQQLCSYCGRTFGSNYNMKNHLAREHGIGQREVVGVCDLCGGKFSDRSSLRNHVRHIHGERKYPCDTCGKRFPSAGTRNHHINEVHNDTYSYQCNLCGQRFSISFKYRYHMRKAHHTQRYACEHCGRTFIMRSDLLRHVRGVHLGIRDPKRYPCRVCGRLFPSKYKVKRHMSSHSILVSEGDTKAVLGEEQQQQGGEGTTPGSSDTATIEVNHLPVSSIYTGASITTLTPELLQQAGVGVGAELVGPEAVVVGSIVVSAPSMGTAAPTTTPTTSAPPDHHHPHHPFTIPVQQMIVIQEAPTTTTTTNTSTATTHPLAHPLPPTDAHHLSLPGSEQVLAVTQVTQGSGGQVVSVPGEVTLHAPPQANFTVTLPQHPDNVTNKLPTIHYQYYQP